jgi:hypothetical protein
MTPRVILTFALEAPPLVEADCGDPDDSRMVGWLDSHPAYWQIIVDALVLVELERGRSA